MTQVYSTVALRSITDGKSSWRKYFPTKNWIQDSLRNRSEPFAEGKATDTNPPSGGGRLGVNSNRYYRRVAVKNLM